MRGILASIQDWDLALYVYVPVLLLNTYPKLYVYVNTYILDSYLAMDIWAAAAATTMGTGITSITINLIGDEWMMSDETMNMDAMIASAAAADSNITITRDTPSATIAAISIRISMNLVGNDASTSSGRRATALNHSRARSSCAASATDIMATIIHITRNSGEMKQGTRENLTVIKGRAIAVEMRRINTIITNLISDDWTMGDEEMSKGATIESATAANGRITITMATPSTFIAVISIRINMSLAENDDITNGERRATTLNLARGKSSYAASATDIMATSISVIMNGGAMELEDRTVTKDRAIAGEVRMITTSSIDLDINLAVRYEVTMTKSRVLR